MNPGNLHYPYGPALARARIRVEPGDFRVDEDLGWEPSDDGEHLYLRVEKCGLTTPELAARLGRQCSLPPRQVSFSGLKDKAALTTQWFSLHLPGRDPEIEAAGDGYRVLCRRRHARKLRRGAHRANVFRLRLREVDDFSAASREQLAALARGGMANYFGAQRFGARGDNVEQALSRLDGSPRKRGQRAMLLSALRSELFNQVLSRRIGQGCWARPLPGDVFMLRGSHSIFDAPLDDEIRRRYDELDISACASLYGRGECRLAGEALAIERAVRADNPRIVACLEANDARLQMRPLRVAVEDLEYDYDAARGVLELAFRLPAGSYATSLLAHFAVAGE